LEGATTPAPAPSSSSIAAFSPGGAAAGGSGHTSATVQKNTQKYVNFERKLHAKEMWRMVPRDLNKAFITEHFKTNPPVEILKSHLCSLFA